MVLKRIPFFGQLVFYAKWGYGTGNQYQASRFSTIANKWERGLERTNIGHLVSQLSPSKSVVQREPISGISFLNYR